MALLKPSALHLVLALNLLLGTELAILQFKSLPTACFTETANQMCHKYFPKAIEDCLDVAEATDYIVNGKKVCYVGFPNRCLPIEFCPEALEKDSTQVNYFKQVTFCNQSPHVC